MSKTVFEYSQKDINDRFKDHWCFAEDFTENILSDKNRIRPGAALFISPRRLHMVIESTYQDIARYKNYHQKDPHNDYLDCTKRSAFFSKWLIKFKPIQIAIPTTDDGVDLTTTYNKVFDDLELINELFVLYCFELHLSDEMKVNYALADMKARQLAYDLLYRDISVDGWMAVFQMLKDCCFPNFVKGNRLIVKI